MKGEIKAQNCVSEHAQSEKQKFEIATAKRRNRNNFSILRFNLFRFWLSLISVFLFASSQAGGWPSGQGAWTLKPRCRHRCEILLYSHFYPCRKLGNKIGKIVVKAVPNPVKQMSKTILRHTLLTNIFDIFVDFLIFIHVHYMKMHRLYKQL